MQILFNSEHFQINFLVGLVLSLCVRMRVWFVSLDWECRKCAIKRLLVVLNVQCDFTFDGGFRVKSV